MKLSLGFLLILSGIFTLTSCNKGSGRHFKAKRQHQSGQEYYSENDPLKKLDEWKARPLKSCAFNHEDRPGLDIKHIIEQNNSSAVFTLGSESVTISTYENMTGSSKIIDTDATFERVGSICVVTVNGEEVYRTLLAQSVTINNHWGHKTTVKSKSLQKGFKDLLKTTKTSGEVLRRALNLSVDEASSFIRVTSNNLDLIYQNSDKNWNATYDNRVQEIEARLLAPKIFDEKQNTINLSDNGNLTFEFRFDPRGSVELMSYKGSKKLDVTEATECLKNIDIRTIGYEELYRYCGQLHPSIKRLAQENGLDKELTLKYYLNSGATSQEGYQKQLKKYFLEAGSSNEDISDWDPDNKSIILRQLIATYDLVFRTVREDAKLEKVKNELMEIGFKWLFKKPAADVDHKTLLFVVGKYQSMMFDTVEQMILDLKKDPYGSAGLGALDFALKISDSDEYKLKVTMAMKEAKEKNDLASYEKLRLAFQNRVLFQK